MNRLTLRAFSLGMLITACLIGAFYFFSKDDYINLSDAKAAKASVKENGYILLSEKEYDELKGRTAEETESSQAEDKPAKEGDKKADPEEKPKQDEQENKAEPKVITYKITISSGMDTGEIASQLAAAKIITNESAFKQYLISSGMHTKIQLGTFELNNEMTSQQIATVITKGR
ncbi:endolytic transglycosylase MltG [Bacillus infantis]|uniref:Endolytic transglycosylase MltG n=1 Tax=Bacillus infantis TaxID=324767 RepID=A0A5D4R232_9BACI|nr:endolytic transglycosylase MltG [Bacillus infantis]TYS44271.1 endolytic transglycosylase MltG [Bacillus infantis]